MASIIPNTGTLAVFRFLLDGDLEPMVVTLGLQEASINGALCAAGLFAAGADADGPFAEANMTSEYSFVGVTVYHRVGAGSVVTEFNEVVSGSAAGAAPSSNCALLVKKVTNGGGRRNRGRMYVPPFGITETNVDARGNINVQLGQQILYDTFFDRLEANAEIPAPVIYHSDGAAGTLITGFAVDSRIATQRKRMR